MLARFVAVRNKWRHLRDKYLISFNCHPSRSAPGFSQGCAQEKFVASLVSPLPV